MGHQNSLVLFTPVGNCRTGGSVHTFSTAPWGGIGCEYPRPKPRCQFMGYWGIHVATYAPSGLDRSNAQEFAISLQSLDKPEAFR
jgi:hypothetical protein